MATLLRRAVVRDGGEPVYVDVELDKAVITIGSAAASVLQLSGVGIAENHAEIRVGAGGGMAQLRAATGAVTQINSKPIQRQTLEVGDEIEIGSNLLRVLETPAGFQLALELQVDEVDSASSLERSHRTSLQQTWLTKRGLAWGLIAVVAAIGLALPLLFGSNAQVQQMGIKPNQLWSAGPLHLAHQDVTEDDCGACHTEPFARVADTACEQCHAEVKVHAQLAGQSLQDQAQPRCASCHAEHGEPAILISPATDHCQGCHNVSSFGVDHPEFSSYPNIGRTRIMFDHQLHAGKHFGKTQREFECAQCHQPDTLGRNMVAGSFAGMCVDCHGAKESTRADVVFHHSDQIVDDNSLSFFVLPRLDLKTLATKELSPALGYWPPETKGGSRAGLTRLGLTKVTELLLSLDPQAVGALELLRSKKIKLASLRRASDEELAAIAALVPAMKELLAQLAQDPRATLAVRLEPLLDRQLQSAELVALTGGLTSSLVQQTADQWFSQAPERASVKTIQDYLGGEVDDQFQATLTRLEAAAPGLGGVQLGAWREQKFSLQYALSGHADDFVRAWIALSAELSSIAEQPGVAEGLKDSVAELQELFADSGAKPGTAKGLGRCTKCHDLQQSNPKTLLAAPAWQGSWRDRAQPGRALFVHEPHLRAPNGGLLADSETCAQCHKPADTADYLVSAYPSGDAVTPEQELVANFEALSPGQCAQCHKPKTAAGDTCLGCHAYHPKHHGNGPIGPYSGANGPYSGLK